jgi:hypothetical protein
MAGECESTGTLPDGSFCFDNSACTLSDHCVGGNCVGTPVVCPGSADQCHPGPTCDPRSGCNNPPEADGTTCDDGDRCTTDDSCKLGVCGGTRVEACHIDQFACYGGGAIAAPVGDRRGSLGGGQFDLGRSTASCHPATDGFPFEDQKTHLTCARVRPKGAPFGSRTLGVHNRLGDATLEVLRPYSLCLPSEEPGQPGAGGLDDYMCYRVRPARARQAVAHPERPVRERRGQDRQGPHALRPHRAQRQQHQGREVESALLLGARLNGNLRPRRSR